jgi:nucleoid-associated protein YgaU
MRFLTASLWTTLVLGLAGIGCTSSNTDNAEVSDSVYTDEVVYVTEDGTQVDPNEINLDDYEIVDETYVGTTPNQAEGADEQLGQILSSIEAEQVTAAPPTSSGYVSLDDPDFVSLDTPDSDLQEDEVMETMASDEGTMQYEDEASEYVSLDAAPESTDSAVESYVESNVQQQNTQPNTSSDLTKYVVVKSGDSLSKIARRIYGKLSMWKKLQQINNVANADLIFPGDRVYYDETGMAVVPAPASKTQVVATTASKTQVVAAPPIANTVKSYVVQAGDTLGSIAKRAYGSTDQWKELYKKNSTAVSTPDAIYPGQTITIR